MSERVLFLVLTTPVLKACLWAFPWKGQSAAGSTMSERINSVSSFKDGFTICHQKPQCFYLLCLEIWASRYF